MSVPRRAPGEGQVYKRERNGRTEYVARLPLNEWRVSLAGKLRRRYWSRVIRADEETAAARRVAERAARKALDDAITDRDGGKMVAPDRVTLAVFLDGWMTHCQDVAKLEAATLQGYRASVRFWANHLGGVRVARLTRQHVQAAIGEAVAAGRATNTVRNHRAILRTALNYARDLDLVAENVAERVRVPDADADEIAPLTHDQVARFIAAVQDDADLVYLFTILTGCRQSEVVGLRWEDVDLDAGAVTIRRKLYRKLGEWHEGRPKSRTSRRVVTILPALADDLARHRRIQLEQQLRAGPAWQGQGLVFCGAFGEPLHGGTLTKRLRRILEAADLPAVTFHGLRHSHATALLTLGVPLELIRKRLGHADRRTTDIYAHVMPELEREASEALGTLLKRYPAQEEAQ